MLFRACTEDTYKKLQNYCAGRAIDVDCLLGHSCSSQAYATLIILRSHQNDIPSPRIKRFGYVFASEKKKKTPPPNTKIDFISHLSHLLGFHRLADP